MFNSAKIFTKILQQLGFDQVVGDCLEKIHPTLLLGGLKISGIREAGSLLNSNKIYSLIDQTDPRNYNSIADFDILTTYSIGETIKNGGIVYVSLVDGNLGNTPIWNSNFWETNYSAYLRKKINDSLQHTVTEMLIENHLKENSKTNEYSTNVFEDREIAFLATPNNGFVGVQMYFNSFTKLAFNISQIAICLDTPQTLPIYLYHSSSEKPISIQNITISASETNTKVWKEVAFNLSYLNESYDAKGMFYLGFYEDDLVGSYKLSKTYYKSNVRHLTNNVMPIYLPTTALNKPNIFVQQTYYQAGNLPTTTALNLFYTATFDYTFEVLANINQFTNLIYKDLAIRILLDCKITNRSNAKQIVSIEQIENILDGRISVNSMGVEYRTKGLISLMSDAKKEIKNNLTLKPKFIQIGK
jgi:hypothetical protein